MKIIFSTIVSLLCSLTLLAQENKMVVVNTDKEPIAAGKFEPTWQSLSQYKVPDWYRNAKFGIWAHWGPQCQPEQGDWYGRFMYNEDSEQYKWHVEHTKAFVPVDVSGMAVGRLSKPPKIDSVSIL